MVVEVDVSFGSRGGNDADIRRTGVDRARQEPGLNIRCTHGIWQVKTLSEAQYIE
jgi:hypothetical protein